MRNVSLPSSVIARRDGLAINGNGTIRRLQ
jgi:hypothetical protein